MDIPQQLSHGWLVTDPAPERHWFWPGTREFFEPFTVRYTDYGMEPARPALPGAARAFLEDVVPVYQAYAQSLAEETARLMEADGALGTYTRDEKAKSLRRDVEKPGGDVDRYLGPFRHPFRGDQLTYWAMGEEPVGWWAVAVSDATNPAKSRTSRRAAAKRAGELQQAAEDQWGWFRAGLDAWSVDAAAWINRSGATVPRPRTAAVQLN